MTVARTPFGVFALVLVAGVGCGTQPSVATRHAPPLTATSTVLSPVAAQALQTCVDRWNQANMVGWGPALVSVAVRRMDSARLAEVGLQNPGLPRCVVSLATEFRRDPSVGCAGATAAPGMPAFCVDRSATANCVINRLGAYGCPTNVDTLRTPLRSQNATTDKHGVLKLDVPPAGTKATPPVGWQRTPHIDGWIEPWTRSGTLRRGLRFATNYNGGGSCGFTSEQVHSRAATRCLWRGKYQVDPCFPQRADWHHPGAVLACPSAPGSTSMGRFVVAVRR